MEENWSFGNLVDSLLTVKKELEVLRGEHQTLIDDINDRQDKEPSDDTNTHEDSLENRTTLLQESKEAILADSLNRLNGGIENSEIFLALVQYVNNLEGDNNKLKAQVRRLADENNWLRQELTKTQKQLQDVDSEVCKIKEEKRHLEYTVSLSRMNPSVNDKAQLSIGQCSDSGVAGSGSGISRSGCDSESCGDGVQELSSDTSLVQQHESYTKLHQLAVQHFRQGRHDVALSLCKKAVQDIEGKHGPINSDRGDLMNIMVVIHREQGRLKEAADMLQEVLEIREKLNGRNHQTVAATLNNLSVLRGKLGEFKVAESLCRKALEIRQMLLGNNHPDVAQQLVNLASLCQHLGKYEEVEWYYQRAIEIYQLEYGPEDENVIKTLNFLGKCYMKQGNLEAAEKVFKKVRSSIQVPEGRESREQSSSPTLLMRTESPEKIPKSLSATRLPREFATGGEWGIQRKQSDPNIAATTTTPKQKVGRSSVSDNVRKLFKWGGSSNTETS